jgi:hypothetical protein
MLSGIDYIFAYNAMNADNYMSLVSHSDSDESGVMLENFIFDPNSLDPEQENIKYDKWDNLSYYAQETIKLLIDMPDCIKRNIVTPNGHLIRKDADIRFFCLIWPIIGFENAKRVFMEVNDFLTDFECNDIPDFRIERNE